MLSNSVLGRCKASTYRRRVRLGLSRSGRLTNSAARTDLALLIRRAVRPAASLAIILSIL